MVSYYSICVIARRERERERQHTKESVCLLLFCYSKQTHASSNTPTQQFQKLLLQKTGASIGADMPSLHCWGDISSWSDDCTILIKSIIVSGIMCHPLASWPSPGLPPAPCIESRCLRVVCFQSSPTLPHTLLYTEPGFQVYESGSQAPLGITVIRIFHINNPT